MEANKKWYAVYTRPRWEKKVADLLVKKHIESYCPLNKIVRQWADRKKLVLEPLFTSYVFVHTTPQEQLAIKQTDGILNFVYWLGQPAVIRDEEIDAVVKYGKDAAGKRLELSEIHRDYRRLMARKNVMGWIAAQTNRKAVGKKYITKDLITFQVLSSAVG